MNKALFILTIIITIITLSACSGSTKSNNATSTDSQTEQQSATTVSSENDNSIAQNGNVVVPNVVGMNVDEAKAKLEDLGLKVENTYKILQIKEIIDGEATYYDNNIVIDQSHKQGTVVVNSTEIELTVNQWNEFIYVINNNNTITLIGLSNSLYYPNKQLYIPKKYNGYKVYCVKSDLLNSKQADTWGNAITYLIPTDVIIDGETSVEIIRY